MKFLRPYTILFLFVSGIACAQEMNKYHLDIYNGLPSNHVYQVITDKYGYLWMATDKGVVKYNGYNMVLYNTSSGMAKEDVWWLYEDKKGRIWCLNISNQLGYIFRNKYKIAVNLSKELLYPDVIKDYYKGVIFTSPDIKRGGWKSIFIERNDTLYQRLISDCPNYYIEQNKILAVYDDSAILYGIDTNNLELYRVSKMPIPQWAANDDSSHGTQRMVGAYRFTFKPGTPFLQLYNSHTSKFVKYNFLVEGDQDICNIAYAHQKLEKYPNSWVIISDKHAYIQDTLLHILKVYNTNDITEQSVNGCALSSIIENSFWQLCASTLSKGVYINYKEKPFKKTVYNIDADYRCIGDASDTVSYWYSRATNTIAKIDRKNVISFKRYLGLDRSEKIIPYNKDSSLLLTMSDTYWLNNRTWAITSILKSIDTFYNPTHSPIALTKASILGAFNGLCYDKNNLLFISIRIGLIRVNITNNNKVYSYPLEPRRFNNIVYDSTRSYVYVYDNNSIFAYKEDSCIYKAGDEELKSLNINSIDQILVDNKYGNIFIKSYDQLINFNPNTKLYTTILNNVVLKDAVVFVKNGRVITVGKFGVAINKIKGFYSIAEPVLIRNIKGGSYNGLYSAGMLGDNVMLNTDKGLYYVNIADSCLNTYAADGVSPRMFVNYNDDIMQLNGHNSVQIYRSNNKISFDIINPYGYGQIKYKYRIKELDTAFQDLNSNELTLPLFIPGKYYTLLLIAYDDAWRSDVKEIQLYIVPYWWQTVWGKRLLWLAGLVILLLTGGAIVLITRRVVNNRNERKNLQLGLELNAVYSQINPHFVFNTLNTAQYFIKKKKTDEAFIHINKFSRLLRAYIKSSRNKYVSVEEEIQNLRNYIELQQERFEDRFVYNITVANETLNKRKIPALLLQPIVENAINHGLFHKEGSGKLLIEVRYGQNNNEIICVIDDDGIGRKKARVLSENSLVKRESYGDQLITDLINVFNKYEKIQIRMEYIDKQEPQTGTIVILTIKNFGYDK